LLSIKTDREDKLGGIPQDRGIMPQREWEFLPMNPGFSAQIAAVPVS